VTKAMKATCWPKTDVPGAEEPSNTKAMGAVVKGCAARRMELLNEAEAILPSRSRQATAIATSPANKLPAALLRRSRSPSPGIAMV